IKWLRNISVALGNAPYQDQIVLALQNRLGINPMLDEHFQWSIRQQLQRREENQVTIQTSQQKRLVRAITKGLPRDA
ncbi:tRNA epoxyqueuosine(34) reductase QueG, partial [Bacillus subtilis]